jgi:hypothetical protein
MKSTKIKNYYLIQLAISFFIAFIGINSIGFINEISDYSQNRLVLLSIVGSSIFLIGNSIINSLNFIFKKNQNSLIAFYIPIAIWSIILIAVIVNLLLQKEFKIVNLIIIIVVSEPIIYNLIIKKKLN